MNNDHLCGCVPPEKWDKVTHRMVNDFIRTLPDPVFELSEAYHVIDGMGDGVDVFHWEAEEVVMGRILPAFHQTIGDCTSMSKGRSQQDQFLLDIAIRKQQEYLPEDLKQLDWFVATEPLYGYGRIEIGKGRISGDGCVASWVAEAALKGGTCFRRKYGRINLTRYDGRRAREYGSRGNGCPDSLEPVMHERRIEAVSPCNSYEAARDAIATLNSPSCGSSQGFSTRRDNNGFCRPSGSWNHDMCWRGCGVALGNRPFIVIQQSWGNSPTGNDLVKLESGREIRLPQGCFCADAEVIDRMAKRGDTNVLSGARGFRRELHHFEVSDLI